MSTFKEANQIRIQLKMKLSNYCWYHSSSVLLSSDDYYIGISVKSLDNQVRKVVPPHIDGVSIKLFTE